MKYLRFLTAALLGLSMVACSGSSVEEVPLVVDENDTFTIVVDKTTIEANGQDVATLHVLNSLGQDITGTKELTISFKNLTTGKRLVPAGTNTFTALADCEQEFNATISGAKVTKDTENTVVVKAQNRSKYEKYKQRVLIYKCTGTWCPACPNMTAALHKVSEELQEHMAVMALHNGDNLSIMFGGYDLMQYLNAQRDFRIQALPTNVYDARLADGAQSSSAIEEHIKNHLIHYPSTCGIKIASAQRNGAEVTVECALKTTKDGKYDLGCALLVDNLYLEGGTSRDNYYHDVPISVTPNYVGAFSQDYWMMTADVEKSKTFTFSDLNEAAKTEDLKVLVFAVSETDEGEVLIDNCQVCPVNGSVDYELN